MSGFDPYLIWLDIPPHERPATHYRLLGLRPLENDSQVISGAAQRVIAHVARFQQTEHAAVCSQLLAELTAARDCLLNPARKQAYDAGISQSMSATAAAATGPAGPLPTQPSSNPAERPIPGPAQSSPVAGTAASPEQPLPSAPQIPTSTSERQIAQSPPVPSSANPSPTPLPNQAPLPMQPAAPTTPVQETPVGAPGGVPQSVQPVGTQPTTQPSAPYGAPQSAGLPTSTPANPPSQPTVPDAVHQQPAPQPPAWAAVERTGQVETVVAGQASSQGVDSSRTHKGRQLRRAQQTQSAYMLVGIAMAMIVFFFGAILLLAIFLGNQ